jgi:hypothetical protein
VGRTDGDRQQFCSADQLNRRDTAGLIVISYVDTLIDANGGKQWYGRQTVIGKV